MKFLARIRTDLQRSLAEQQRAAVLAVLRARLGELTLDDVHDLIASPLGKGLGVIRVLDLVEGAAPSPTSPAQKPTKKPKKSRARKRSAREKSVPGTITSAKVLQALNMAEKPLRRGAIAEQLGVSPLSLNKPLRLLVYDGSVIAEGPANRRLYSVPRITRAASTDAAEAASPKPKPKRSKRKSASQAAKRRSRRRGSASKQVSPPGVSPKKRAELVRYGAVVLDTVKAAGGWIGSAALRAKTGGTKGQFKRAVKKLEASGEIVRRGNRGLTQFAVAGTLP